MWIKDAAKEWDPEGFIHKNYVKERMTEARSDKAPAESCPCPSVRGNNKCRDTPGPIISLRLIHIH